MGRKIYKLWDVFMNQPVMVTFPGLKQVSWARVYNRAKVWGCVQKVYCKKRDGLMSGSRICKTVLRKTVSPRTTNWNLSQISIEGEKRGV